MAADVASGAVTFTFAFSEDVGTSFEEADVEVTGGDASGFSSDGVTASIVVTPPADATGTVQVAVAAGTFEDAAGNANTDAASASQDYDTSMPVVETVLIDFEGDPPVLTGFGGSTGSVVADPTDGSNTVGQVDKSDSAELWAGVTVSNCPGLGIAELPFADGMTSLTLDVWSPDAGIPVRVKVENSSDPTTSVETEATTTTASSWETLTFDFSNEADGTAAINLAAVYDKASVFFNFGTTGADAGAKTYYMDDLVFPGADFVPECPEVPEAETWPVTFDDPDTSYTLIGFGGAEDATIVVDPDSGTGNVVRVVKHDGAEVWAGTTMGTLPGALVSPVPLEAGHDHDAGAGLDRQGLRPGAAEDREQRRRRQVRRDHRHHQRRVRLGHPHLGHVGLRLGHHLRQGVDLLRLRHVRRRRRRRHLLRRPHRGGAVGPSVATRPRPGASRA